MMWEYLKKMLKKSQVTFMQYRLKQFYIAKQENVSMQTKFNSAVKQL